MKSSQEGKPMGGKQDRPVRITVDLPRALWRKVKIRAMDEGKSVQGLVRELLEAHTQKRGRA
jgi:hypothetical protein